MGGFIKIDAQEVMHESGYHVFSAGREHIGYKDDNKSYRVLRELGWDPKTKSGYESIYSSDIFDENMKKVVISKKEKDEIISRIVTAEKFMTKFTIEVVK
ncbi:hypothetical protein [Obesumbacterium proteus]|uniref:Uncharacterized protein n=1 Tax=Obesumbacterium proteus ATCC 12841 TaxID=1354268 RepID=A0AA91INL7_9GAMM|nr:hypothetical protein [Obesumbacterium proteus]OAT57716.1 hypothetical protein M993_03460 [Obesumbacterium proteus ATCC 12841]TBL46878.1 hypothetical protein EYY98_23570 [Obesumbacterium proteus]